MIQIVLLGILNGFSFFPVYMGMTHAFFKLFHPHGVALIVSAIVSTLSVGFVLFGSHWLASWPLSGFPELRTYFAVALLAGGLLGKFVFRNRFKVG